MNLKVGEHTLTESLSIPLFCSVNKWHVDNFNSHISVEKCQQILLDYDFVIHWIHSEEDKDLELDKETYFYLTIVNSQILSTKLKGITDNHIYLGILGYEDLDSDDECLLQILEKEKKNNDLNT